MWLERDKVVSLKKALRLDREDARDRRVRPFAVEVKSRRVVVGRKGSCSRVPLVSNVNASLRPAGGKAWEMIESGR